MTVTIFVPRDSTALALGANETAAAIAKEAQRFARHVLAGTAG
jgi:formate dehydrogenase iron-sulfur subunit